MDYLEMFNKLSEFATELNLKIEIEVRKGFTFITVLSLKYNTCKCIKADEILDIDKIDFRETAAKDTAERYIKQCKNLGYSSEEIEKMILDVLVEDEQEEYAIPF